ncbi:MAG: hypothetical protein COV67_15400 [Nitrospinae bacterium CG11_big_fil_rev_8_21_14_0_20_56_8]|nr:MAG: hypothetical protein COV67_15400 [Nitrospinae bacterium CG11_big_fil_rev_8_21_14_0_20_56_8]
MSNAGPLCIGASVGSPFNMGISFMTPDEVLWLKPLLKQTRVFSVLTDSELEDFLNEMGIYDFKAGEVIIKQGEEADLFFVVYKGEVKVTVKRMFFKTVEMSHLKPGEIFGEMALLTYHNRTATLCAVKDTTCFVLFKSSFQYLVEKNPLFKNHVKAVVREREEELKKI